MHSLTDSIFTTSFTTTAFSPDSVIKSMKAFEIALIRALERNLFLSSTNSAELTRLIRSTEISAAQLSKKTVLAGNVSIPFVQLLTASVENTNKNLSQWIHFGATSQDLIDTALIGQLRVTYLHLNSKILELSAHLAKMANTHKKTAMMGRTLLQQAKPITFGYKVAGWLNELLEIKKEVDGLILEGFPIQFGGAVGTLSAFGNKGDEVMEALAEELSLSKAEMPWHSNRRPLLKIAQNLNLLCSVLGKMAKDIILLMQTEISEVSEGKTNGKGGSSAMPHKQNPVSALFIVAIANKSTALLSGFQNTFIQEHERAAGNWQSEWNLFPELAGLTLSAVQHASDLMEHLEIHDLKMLKNLGLTNGLIFSEELTALISKQVGKIEATTFVKSACEETLKSGTPLRETILNQIKLDDLDLNKVFDIHTATGLSEYYVHKILNKYKNYAEQRN